jgi:inorganic triphosphatase YgiF
LQELEAKFLTSAGERPEEVLRRLQQSLAWAGFRIQPRGRRIFTDVYFDTTDHQLRTAGWSYRQRDDANGRSIALQEINRARAAVFDRQEVEQPVDRDADLRHPGPGPVQERLSNLLHPEAEIAPLFAVENRRAAYRLSHPDHPRGLVEMAFDDARIRAGNHIDFTELELELKDGPHELLASILAAVELEPALIDARLSKFERGLITAGWPLERRRGGPPQALGLQSRWLDVALAYLKTQLVQIKLYEPYAWEGVHEEGVHQMRVATRKAGAALVAFAPVLPEEQSARLAAGLHWLAGVLGEVRDLDVHRKRLSDYRSKLEPIEQRVLGHYESHLRGLQATAQEQLVHGLAGAAYTAVLGDYRGLLQAAAQPEHGSRLRLEDVARTAVTPLLDRVWLQVRRLHHLLRLDAGDGDGGRSRSEVLGAKPITCAHLPDC